MVKNNDDAQDKPIEAVNDAPISGDTSNDSPTLKTLERIVQTISKAIFSVSVVALAALIIIICIDVIGGKFFDSPVPGFAGVLGIAQLLVISFAMGTTFFTGHHIKVELILNRCPPRLQAVVNALTSLMGFMLFVLIIWQLVALGMSFQASGQVLDTVFIPLHPFVYATAFAFLPVCLGLFLDFIKALRGAAHKGSGSGRLTTACF